MGKSKRPVMIKRRDITLEPALEELAGAPDGAPARDMLAKKFFPLVEAALRERPYTTTGLLNLRHGPALRPVPRRRLALN